MKRNFVGQKIRALRKERGMTQSELATRVGIIQSDLCRMEKGEYRVGLDTLFRILEVFGMNIGEFFGEHAQEDASASQEVELAERFRRLSPEGAHGGPGLRALQGRAGRRADAAREGALLVSDRTGGTEDRFERS